MSNIILAILIMALGIYFACALMGNNDKEQ